MGSGGKANLEGGFWLHHRLDSRVWREMGCALLKLFGDEEAEIIAPAIADARRDGIQLEGPVPADLMLHRDDVDAFIMMLHDQGHIPAKVMARYGAAGVIIGSPIQFASVGHGSALDIAGQGIGNPVAMIEAIRWFFGETQSP